MFNKMILLFFPNRGSLRNMGEYRLPCEDTLYHPPLEYHLVWYLEIGRRRLEYLWWRDRSSILLSLDDQSVSWKMSKRAIKKNNG